MKSTLAAARADAKVDRDDSVMSRIAKRFDGWQNLFTGFGDPNRDKTLQATYEWDAPLSLQELSSLYHSDDMASKIVDIVPREMLRQGFRVTGIADPALLAKLESTMRRLRVMQQVKDAIIWGRAYGGGLLFLGARDGQDDAAKPLVTAAVTAIDFLHVYDRRFANPFSWYEDPRAERFLEPQIYQLQNIRGGTSYVHDSRCVVFHGAHTDPVERLRLNGWDYSVLQKCYGPLRQFHSAFNALELMLSDASQGVLKVSGLLDAIASGRQNDLHTRASLLDMSRSIARSLMLDADSNESYEKIATQFSGVSDAIDRASNRLSAAAEIPVTLLMGQAPAGLSATGESDIRTFYDVIRAAQEQDLTPVLERIVRLILTSLGAQQQAFEIVFPPLWQETASERTTRRKTIAETDAIYLANDVLTPEEVARSRFGGEYSDETTIDVAAREGIFLAPKGS